MPNQETFTYIRDHLNQGYSIDVIRQHFVDVGWPASAAEDVIKNYFAALHHQQNDTYRQADTIPPRSNLPRKILIAGFILVSIVLVIAAVTIDSKKQPPSAVLQPSSSPAATPTASPSIASGALTRNAQNTARKNDAAVIAAAINTYITNSSGQLPTTVSSGSGSDMLNICGSDCSGKQTVKLDHYAAASVSFKEAAANLVVPNTETLYIVNRTSCNAAHTGLSDQTPTFNLPTYVILYATDNGKDSSPQCLSP